MTDVWHPALPSPRRTAPRERRCAPASGRRHLDGFELLLARQDKDIYLGVFNWGDTPKEYTLPAFAKSGPVKLAGRHSVMLKHDGKESLAQLCQKLQSR